MYRDAWVSCLLLVAFSAMAGCSGPSSAELKKPAAPPDKIQGKAKIADWETSANDQALNGGGPTVYLVDGLRRYRLFFNKAVPVENGKEYVAEGVYAQKAIDAIGDPDMGKNGYPLTSSCEQVVTRAWPGLAFDVTDGDSSILHERVKRYPARAIFLVRRLALAPAKEGAPDTAAAKADTDEDLPEVTVPAEKERAFLLEGPSVQNAPLWQPEGGTESCKVTIGKDGKISSLDTGAQLCEAVDWSQFRYKPPVRAGHPVNVKTEVAVRFEAKK